MAGACRGHWAEPGLLTGWSADSWIVGAEVGLLQCWSGGSGRGTPLQRHEKKKGPAGASTVVTPMPKSVLGLMREKIVCLEGECVVYVCVPFTDGVALYL